MKINSTVLSTLEATATDRLVQLYALGANHREKSARLNWYRDANRHFKAVARRLNLTDKTVLGIVAALSPQVPWNHQLTQTEPFIAAELVQPGSGTHAGFTQNLQKARAILNSGAPMDYLRGRKVVAFFRALCGDPNAVVLDRWAIKAALGITGTLKNVPADSVMDALERAYRQAATVAGVSPAALQATVWVHVRDNGIE